MVHVPKPSVQPERKHKDGPESEPEEDNGKKPEPTAQEFRYEIRPGGFDGIYTLVKKIAILNLDKDWKSSKKELMAELRVGDAHLTINSPIVDHILLKDVLNVISTKNPDGDATITVISESDLGEFFRENDLEAYVR